MQMQEAVSVGGISLTLFIFLRKIRRKVDVVTPDAISSFVKPYIKVILIYN